MVWNPHHPCTVPRSVCSILLIDPHCGSINKILQSTKYSGSSTASRLPCCVLVTEWALAPTCATILDSTYLVCQRTISWSACMIRIIVAVAKRPTVSFLSINHHVQRYHSITLLSQTKLQIWSKGSTAIAVLDVIRNRLLAEFWNSPWL